MAEIYLFCALLFAIVYIAGAVWMFRYCNRTILSSHPELMVLKYIFCCIMAVFWPVAGATYMWEKIMVKIGE